MFTLPPPPPPPPGIIERLDYNNNIMSSWLQNVGNFLEKLDDQAERVAEVAVVGDDDDDDNVLGSNAVPEDVQLQSILTARGLHVTSHDDDDDEEEEVNGQEKVQESIPEQEESSMTVAENVGEEKEGDISNEQAVPDTREEEGVIEDATTTTTTYLEFKPVHDEHQPELQTMVVSNDGNTTTETTLLQSDAQQSSSSISSTTDADVEQQQPQQDDEKKANLQGVVSTNKKIMSAVTTTPSSTSATTKQDVLSPTSHAALRESQKEARTLRRHVVSLNKHLEHAETELKAQREELERAAERLEKDRIRHKDDREKEKTRHAEELKGIQTQNDKTMKELKQRLDKQIEELRKQLRDGEERRMQEGGDWNKELVDAVQREQEMAQKYALLEDEKATLLSQISILHDQQEALGNRIESLSQTADNAMDRERESETRLDEALNLHARQIAQRQGRESDLERTVAELGAALVAARSNNTTTTTTSNGGSLSKVDFSSSVSSNVATPEAQVQSLQQDLESMVAQLNFEKQRSDTLQKELRDVSRERTEETSVYHARQIKDDRKIAELSHTIARLESEQQQQQQRGIGGIGTANTIDGKGHTLTEQREDMEHMRHLSEEVLRQREKIANSNSEISALKSRLKVANGRIQVAESTLESYKNRDDGDWRDIEQAPMSGDGGMRRRGGGTSGSGSSGKWLSSSRRMKQEESMRAALHLDAVRSKSSEQIGKALDGVDAFLVSSGRFLRHNALARLLFIAYLLLFHIWTFVLIFIHTNGYETIHGDFGAGIGIANGPHALMQEGMVTLPQQQAAVPAGAAAVDGPVQIAASAAAVVAQNVPRPQPAVAPTVAAVAGSPH